MRQISVEELKARLDNGEQLALLDVRQPEEWNLCHLPGSVLLPLGELPHRHSELDPQKEWVVICHHGIRSQHAIAYLSQLGFTKLHNLSGGIHAWATRIDPTMPRY